MDKIKVTVFLVLLFVTSMLQSEIKTVQTLNAEIKYIGINRIIDIPVATYYGYKGFKIDNFYIMSDNFAKSINELNVIHNWRMFKTVLNETFVIENPVRVSVNITYNYITFIFDIDSMKDTSLKSFTVVIGLKEFYKKI